VAILKSLEGRGTNPAVLSIVKQGADKKLSVGRNVDEKKSYQRSQEEDSTGVR